MQVSNTLLCVAYLMLASGGAILMKLGGRVGKVILTIPLVGVSYSWVSLLGMCFYGCSFVLYTFIINRMRISYVSSLMAGVIICITTGAGILLFKERLTTIQIVGICFIVMGAVLMGVRS